MITALSAAIVLGLAGSLHCAGMCGPLVLALPGSPSQGWSWWSGRLLNQLGRILTYVALGAVVGLLGESLVTAGWQQALAIGAGVLMLFFIAWPAGLKNFNRGPFRFVGWLKARFAVLLQQRSRTALFLLGVLNGLLPCGLVYIALAAALALGDVAESALFMAVFGVGTSPVLLAISGFGTFFRDKLRFRTYRVLQVFLACIALIIILRGANLGIPYLSPAVKAETQEVDCCHRPR